MDSLYFHNYLFIGLLALIALGFGLFPLFLSRKLTSCEPSQSKSQPCDGTVGRDDAWVSFYLPYTSYALLFVIFSVGVVFLFPWALIWKNLGWMAFLEMVVFLGTLSVAWVYAWRKGVLEWR